MKTVNIKESIAGFIKEFRGKLHAMKVPRQIRLNDPKFLQNYHLILTDEAFNN